jgi:hypothetical protein
MKTPPDGSRPFICCVAFYLSAYRASIRLDRSCASWRSGRDRGLSAIVRASSTLNTAYSSARFSVWRCKELTRIPSLMYATTCRLGACMY